ncbi:MAG TPA: CBS domain-containing protein, partial [Oculatellaceae cyanobacterium]
ATLTYLAFMNGILIVFNLVPAFPLDGGRVLRALLWQWKKSLRWATRIASNCGKWFGLLLIFLGGLNILQGEFISGIWWVLIGLFLRQAADASYQQVLLKRYIEGIPVKQLMRTDVVTVPAETSIRRLIDNYFYHHYFKGYPVVEGDSLVGYVSLPEIRQLSLENREQKTVREVMTPPSDTNTIQADADTMLALARMRDTGTSTLLVTDSENRLVGLISLKDLLHFFAMKIELEENGKQ